jgi:phosphatidylglycerol:prolipoprotein diacylglycerol transferase
VKFPNGMPPTTAQNLSAWGVEVPPGTDPFEVLAVHPTQLYETALMLFAFWLLWRWRNHSRGTGWLFGLYLVLAGTERFLIEFIRAKDDRFLGHFTLAQAMALGVVVIGIVLASQLGSKGKVSVEQIEALNLEGGKGQPKPSS